MKVMLLLCACSTFALHDMVHLTTACEVLKLLSMPQHCKGSHSALTCCIDQFSQQKLKLTSSCAGELSQLVLSQLGTAITGVLTSLLCNSSSSAAANSFSRIGSLLEALQAVADQKALTEHVAGPVAAALVGPVQQGNALPEAASLLARVVKQFGAEVLTAAPAAALPGGGRTTGTLHISHLHILPMSIMSCTVLFLGNLGAGECIVCTPND